MTTTIGTQTNEWLEKARALAPLVVQYRDDCERERRLPQPIFEAIRDAGLFRVLVPRSFGGPQVSIETAMNVIEEFSRQDGAVGWNVMIAGHMCLLADYLPASSAQAIYVPDSVVAGSLNATGRAERTPGGFRVSGRWAFASGCSQAKWFAATCTVTTDETPGGGQGLPERVVAFFPMSEARIIDTWETAGLRGTGSHDVEVDGAFVPDEMSFSQPRLQTGPVEQPGAAYPQGFFQLASPTVAVVALGIARNAIDSFIELAGAKTPSRATTKLAVQHTVQQRVGRAEALLRAGRSYLYETARRLMDETDHVDHEEMTASMLLAGSHAAQNAVEAVDLLFDAAGSTSIYATSPLERCFRDVHIVTHHLIVSPTNVEMVGQFLLGLGFQLRR